jgi:phenylpyruvate tautomerase PptA (4-oxalocrotonate tautomerase family)
MPKSFFVLASIPKGRLLAIVRVDYPKHQATGFASTLSGTINSIMQQVLGVPPEENYVICQAHEASSLLHAPNHCPPERLAEIVFIQVTLNQGRAPELKEAFFQALTQAIASSGLIQSENIFINLVEVARENWSFGISSTPNPTSAI